MKTKNFVLVVLAIVVLSAFMGAIAGSIFSLNLLDSNEQSSINNNLENQYRYTPYFNFSNNESAVLSGRYSRLYAGTIDSVIMVRSVNTNGFSIGSGFIYDRNGHIVTNEHVVNNADEVLVRFRDGSWQEASVDGMDVYTDLAVLDVQNLPGFARPLPIKNKNPNPGQPVAALGSPFGLEGSITSGIVSGVNRSMSTNRDFSIPATIQIDAPLNPGNSGGPLLNMNGTVIGVNRATEGDNIGFAISPLLVNKVVPRLIQTGEYNHPYLGITSVPLNPIRAEANNLENSYGVIVVDTIQGGPAERILEPSTSITTRNGMSIPIGGDIITHIDGTRIEDQQDLSRYLMLNTNPGETIDITVIRKNEKKTLSVTLAERPDPTTPLT